MSYEFSLFFDNIKNIKNIKLLNKYKSDTKEKIKSNNNKIKVVKNIIKELNNTLERNEKKIKKLMTNNKIKKRFVCIKCGIKKLTKNELDEHKCVFNYYRDCNIIYDHLLHDVLRENHILNTDINGKNKNIDYTKLYNKRLDEILYEIQITIKKVSLVCQKCKKNSGCLEDCQCNFNHMLCSFCIKDIDKCPLCLEILNYEICPICLEDKKHIIDVNCGNNHKICKKCINTVLDTNPKCPFCREHIK